LAGSKFTDWRAWPVRARGYDSSSFWSDWDERASPMNEHVETAHPAKVERAFHTVFSIQVIV